MEKIASPWVEKECDIEEKIKDEEKRREEKKEKIGKEVKDKEEQEDEADLDMQFKKEELERAIRNVKEKSAPGLDGVEYKMIKELPNGYKEEILKLFNWCFTKGKQFSDWK